MAASRIKEAIDVFEDGHLGLSACVPNVPPDQLRLNGYEEGFNGGIIVTISLTAHGYIESMLAQDFW
jgi:hypothetical protein